MRERNPICSPKGRVIFCSMRVGGDPKRWKTLMAVRSTYIPALVRVCETDDGILLYEEKIQSQPAEKLKGSELRSAACNLAQALSDLHAQNFVHGAVCAENIRRLSDGRYVLIDPAEEASDARQDLVAYGRMMQDFGCEGSLSRIAHRCVTGRIRSARELCGELEKAGQKKKNILRRACMAAAMFAVLLCGIVSVYAMQKEKENKLPAAAPVIASEESVPLSQPVTTALPAAAAAPAECVCDYDVRGAKIAAEPERLIFADGQDCGATVSVQCTAYREGCDAAVHDEMKLIGGRIEPVTVGGEAQITQDGCLTVTSPGVFTVSGVMELRGETYYAQPATVFALEEDQYTDACRCVFDFEKGKPCFGAHGTLNEDGLLYLDMCVEEVIDNRACNAEKHHSVIKAYGEVIEWPEGAQCGVDEQNRFYTDTVGKYVLQVNFCFGGRKESCTCEMIVDE